MATWIEDEALKARLLGVLQKAQFEVETPWDLIISDSNQAAYDDIVRILGQQGYTLAQLNEWDSRATFNIDLALFWCLVKGGCTKDFDEKFIVMLDRRPELEDFALVIDGDVVPPEPTPGVYAGTIRSGTMKNDNDLFSL